MSHGLKVAFLVFAMSVGSGGAMAADDPALICDAAAASPEDLDLPDGVSGVAFDALDPSGAIEAACLAAIEAHPAERRFHAHLGRIYAKRGASLKALEAYRTAHARGSAVAANNLGAMYIRGDGVTANETHSTRLIRHAAHRGLVHAMGTMAFRAREGRGMIASDALSFYWYQKASDAGDAIATNDLGVMYQQGRGVRENDEKALSMFSEALERDPGAGIAAYNIAQAYENGEGVEADLAWARGYYVTAFNAGYADAADDLGRFHAEGLGTVADPVRAFEWYQRGAEAGSLYAMVSLGDVYLAGTGVDADADQAEALYNQALDQGPDEAWRAYVEDRLGAVVKLKTSGPVETTE